jgi:hypothetical protein
MVASTKRTNEAKTLTGQAQNCPGGVGVVRRYSARYRRDRSLDRCRVPCHCGRSRHSVTYAIQ